MLIILGQVSYLLSLGNQRLVKLGVDQGNGSHLMQKFDTKNSIFLAES